MDQLPTETQFLLLEHEDHGVYSIVLPLICGDFRATLKADRDRCGTGFSGVGNMDPISGDTKVTQLHPTLGLRSLSHFKSKKYSRV